MVHSITDVTIYHVATLKAHALTGQEYEAQLERGVRMLYDENTGNWITIPICLEIYVPEVTRALYKMGKELPNWTNLAEKVLSLRAAKYDTQKALAWKMTEMEFSGEDADAPAAVSTTITQRNATGAVRDEQQVVLLREQLSKDLPPATVDAIITSFKQSNAAAAAADEAAGGFDPEKVMQRAEETQLAKTMAKTMGTTGMVSAEAEADMLQMRGDIEKLTSELLAKDAKFKEAVLDLEAKTEQGGNADGAIQKLKDEKTELEKEVATLKKGQDDLSATTNAAAAEKAQADAGFAVKNAQLEERIKSLTEQLSAVAGAGGSLEASLAKVEKSLVHCAFFDRSFLSRMPFVPHMFA
jgi:hypothetical protein